LSIHKTKDKHNSFSVEQTQSRCTCGRALKTRCVKMQQRDKGDY